MKTLLYIVAAFLAGCIATAIFFTANTPDVLNEAVTKTVTLYDTIPYHHAVARDSVVLRYETHGLPIADDKSPEHEHKECIQAEAPAKTDSAEVAIPITQKEYQDSTYHLWISGYAANLDSIHTYARHDYTTVLLPTTKSNRWHLGVAAGYGYTPKGFQPYIGISISYSILSWK